MRRVCGAGREVGEEGTIRCDRLLSSHPVDAVIGQVAGEVVAILRLTRNRHSARAPVQRRIELVGLAADKAVEVIEASARWPVVERASLAGLVVRDIVVFPPPAGGITVFV